MDAKADCTPAVLWGSLTDQTVECHLCAHRCQITLGGQGRCGLRQNHAGQLMTTTYGRICSAAADPIEKKPLFHFQPGSKSFSVATPGCNFQCNFCQNWQISQAPHATSIASHAVTSPERVVQAAQDLGCASIAYTYTEPTLLMEWAADCGRLAKDAGMANVFVSNGYMTPETIAFVSPWLDGINIDLKAFNEAFYSQLCKARLEPVLDCIRRIANDTDIWLEVTTLLIPGKNDSETELQALAAWLVQEAGVDVPWHISRFYPQYQTDVTEPTPLATLERAYAIGKAAGLRYVYLGNVPGSQTESTYCPHCEQVLIERRGYQIRSKHLENGECPVCHTVIAGLGLSC